MPLSAWSPTAGSNTTIGGVNIAEGMAPSDVNNAQREMMAELQPSIYVDGRPTAIAGSKARVDWVIDDSRSPVENVGGLWASVIRIARAIGQVFVAADGAANAPQIASLSYAKNAGSPADVVSNMQVAEAGAANASVFGGNTIVFSSGGFNNCKLIGWEIDVQPQAASTPLSAAGLIINAFTMTAPGPAIYFEGVSGGKWSTGINVGNLSDTGAGIAPASANPRMGTLLDSGVANYQIGAIKLNNTHAIVFYNAAGSGPAAKRYCDSSNTLRDLLQPAGLLFRDAADANTYASVSSSGVLVVSGGVGYATGAGGTVTQATSKATGVTLNKTCGSITLNAAALAANTIVSFTLTNSAIAADDDVRVWVKSGNASVGSYRVAGEGNAAGSRTIVVENKTAGSLSEAIVLGFSIVKAVVA